MWRPGVDGVAAMKLRFATLAAVVLVLALGLRWRTLVFPHDHGDQLIYSALADNIRHARPYNLTCVGLAATPVAVAATADDAVLLGFRPPASSSNSLAAAFDEGGLDIYNEPLYFHAPGFAALVAGFSIVQGAAQIHVLSIPAMRQVRNPGQVYERWSRRTPLGDKLALARAQAPAVVPSLLASLAVVLMTMLWARTNGGLAPLWAGLIIALSPVDVFASQRVLADTTMVACGLGSVLLLRAALQHTRRAYFIAAILAAACAVYVKESAAVILVLAAVLTAACTQPRRLYLLYACLVALTLVPWLLVLHSQTGRWLPVPPTPQLPASGYRLLTAERTFLKHAWEVVYLSPLLCVGVCWFGYASRAVRTRMTLGMGIVLAVFLLAMAKAFEHRYLLAAYPFMASAAAWGLEQLRKWMNQRFQPVAGVALVLVLIAASAVWGLSRAWPSIMGNAGDIFLAP
jgi:hypothetical protein